jgi:4-diphosphocytidyl-2-C-methyl-D-erythritol kinase
VSAVLAPAKVNLYLHVGAPEADGYHPLWSLVTFADIGDWIRLQPAGGFEFAATGPFAADLGSTDDNLVVRAIGELAALAGSALPPIRVELDKQLPVAAGLGGGSSDAAAALRQVRDRCFPAIPDGALVEILGRLGADGPMCFEARPVTASGRGDRLSGAPQMPALHAVLVNPRAACPTGEIYKAFDRADQFAAPLPGDLRSAYEDVGDLAEDLARCRNDLEPAARAYGREVAAALDLLASRPEALLARLSGSGATAFALCAGAEAAGVLAGHLRALQPKWWVRPCVLGGPKR